MSQLYGNPRARVGISYKEKFFVTQKSRFSAKFRNFYSGKWAEVQLPFFSFPDGFWASPYNESKNLAPSLRIWRKWDEIFCWWSFSAGLVRACTRGPSGVQNKTTIEHLGLTIWSQEPREKVSILKFWLLRPIWGRCSPRTLTPRWDIFCD